MSARILGIDPGYGRVGVGIIEQAGRGWKHVMHECIETDKTQTLVQRLFAIRSHLEQIIDEYQPHVASVEKLFFSKNTTTALDVAQARGVILVSLHQKKLPIAEFTPNEIKQAMTGYGSADKHQMQEMVKMQLSLEQIPKPDDAADALAVALTCAFSA